jgi:hypothetical protein
MHYKSAPFEVLARYRDDKPGSEHFPAPVNCGTDSSPNRGVDAWSVTAGCKHRDTHCFSLSEALDFLTPIRAASALQFSGGLHMDLSGARFCPSRLWQIQGENTFL